MRREKGKKDGVIGARDEPKDNAGHVHVMGKLWPVIYFPFPASVYMRVYRTAS